MKKAKKAISNQYLIDERVRNGWSQQDIADRVGTTSVNVSRWERGATSPNPYFRQQLMELFGKSAQELGLLPLNSPSESPSSEPFEQAPSPSNLPNNEQKPEKPFLIQETGPSQTDEGKQVSASKPFALPYASPPVAPLAHFHTRQSLHTPFAIRVITLTSLVVLFVMAGLFWFNATHPTPIGYGKSSRSSKSSKFFNVNTGEPVPAFYYVQGQLALDDTLHNDVTQGGWEISAPGDRLGCHFINGAYDVKQLQNNYCLANNPSDAADFVYQIDMTIVQGSQAGIIFRANDGQQYYYDFEIGVDGSYRFYRSVPNALSTVVMNQSSAAINKGYHSLNHLAVKALGTDISLYVNFQLIAHFQDMHYTRGNVGVVAVVNDGAIIHGQGVTEVIYNNAKVWNLSA